MNGRMVAAAVAPLAVPLAMAMAAGCAVASGSPGRPATGASQVAYPARFVASVEGANRAGSGIAVFSSATGRLERWLVRGAEGLQPVTVGPGGRWVYYVSATSNPWCAGNGYTQPVLWRVPSGGGRPRQAGLRTSSIAFSPDGRMAAYVWTRYCGHTVWIVVRDRRAGTSRRIFLTRNAPTANNTFATAQLSWSPDDRHLAVSVSPAAAINTLSVANARKATTLPASEIRPCANSSVGCIDPSFTAGGALIFVKWQEQATALAGRIVRWQRGRVTVLLRLSPAQTAGPRWIAPDLAGNAILVQGGDQKIAIWRWVSGRTVLLLRSTPRRTVTMPLWLPRR